MGGKIKILDQDEADWELAEKLAADWGFRFRCDKGQLTYCEDAGDCLDCNDWEQSGDDSRKAFFNLAKLAREHIITKLVEG